MGKSFFFGIFFTALSFACTTVQLPTSKEKVVGKSYDWDHDSAFVIINKKNVDKKAFLIPFLQPFPKAKWTSTHASITFNQYGAELPNSGMNDAGLVIEVMWLNEAKTPAKSDLQAVNEAQWIQYHLDNFATVDDMIQNQKADAKKRVRVAKVWANVHYMACDAKGVCATFEYLDGNEKITINAGGENTIPTLTNDTYKKSLDTYADFVKTGGPAPEKCVDSLDRFICATEYAKKFDLKLNPVNYAFETLNRVWVNSDDDKSTQTVWNIVYEPAAEVKKVHFRTRAANKVKTVVFKDYNPSCKQPAQILDINTPEEGDVTKKFKDFTVAENKEYLKKAVAGNDDLKPFVEIASKYQTDENLHCNEK